MTESSALPVFSLSKLRVVLVIFSVLYIASCIYALAAGVLKSCEDQVVGLETVRVCRPIQLTDPLGVMAVTLFVLSVLVIVGSNVASISLGGDRWLAVDFRGSTSTTLPQPSSEMRPEVEAQGLEQILSGEHVAVLRLVLLGAAASHADSLIYAYYHITPKAIGYCWASTIRPPSAPRTYEGLVGSKVLLDLVQSKVTGRATSSEWVNYNPVAIDTVRPCFFSPVVSDEGYRLGVLAVLPVMVDGNEVLSESRHSIRAQLQVAAETVGHALSPALDAGENVSTGLPGSRTVAQGTGYADPMEHRSN